MVKILKLFKILDANLKTWTDTRIGNMYVLINTLCQIEFTHISGHFIVIDISYINNNVWCPHILCIAVYIFSV